MGSVGLGTVSKKGSTVNGILGSVAVHLGDTVRKK